MKILLPVVRAYTHGPREETHQRPGRLLTRHQKVLEVYRSLSLAPSRSFGHLEVVRDKNYVVC